MRMFLSVASVLLLLLGLGWLLLPGAMLDRWGVQSDAVGMFVGRRYGGMLLGYSAILWLGRASGASSARAAILGGGTLVAAVVTVLSLSGVLRGIIGAGGWATVVVEALLTAGFLYFWLFGSTRQPAQP